MADAVKSHLLSLPQEIRRLIFIQHYENVTVVVRIPPRTDTPNKAPSRAIALMQTCRQLLNETPSLFYDHATFRIRYPHRSSGWDENDDYASRLLTSKRLRRINISITDLNFIGYDFSSPENSVIKRPFEQVKHLWVEADLMGCFTVSIADVLDQRVCRRTSDAEITRRIVEVLGDKRQISLSITWHDLCFGGPFTLEIADFKQLATWRCHGQGVDEHIESACKFMQNWGLSVNEARAIAAASDIERYLPEHINDWSTFFEEHDSSDDDDDDNDGDGREEEEEVQQIR